MNWGALVVALGLVAVAVMTAPYGLVILAGLYWIWRKS